MSAGDFTQGLQVRQNAGKACIYNSRIGKFTQPDTIIPGAGNPQAFNRYAYVLNNPVNFADPSGHWRSSGCFAVSGRGVPCGEILLDGEWTSGEVESGVAFSNSGGSGGGGNGGGGSGGGGGGGNGGDGGVGGNGGNTDTCLDQLWWCGLDVINGDLGELGIAANCGGDGTANGGHHPTCWAVIDKSSPYFQLYIKWLLGLADASKLDRKNNDILLAIAGTLAGIAATLGGAGAPISIGIGAGTGAAGYTMSGVLDVDHVPYGDAAKAMRTIANERGRVLLIWNNQGEQNLLVCNTDWQNCTDTGPVYSTFGPSFLKIHQALDENFSYR